MEQGVVVEVRNVVPVLGGEAAHAR